jgi:RNA polymerase sigma factor (TIGR02999 family)
MSDGTPGIDADSPRMPNHAEELLPLFYDELRKLAAAKMARENPGHTLQPTALVHEVWMRLGEGVFENRAHFFAAASEAMRRVLVDSARRKKSEKHGGKLEKVDVAGVQVPLPVPVDELLALDEALERLAAVDTSAAEVVKLSFFVGLTHEQVARELEVSLSTVERRWSFARAWLFGEMRKTLES